MVRSKPRSVQASQAVVCKRSVDVARPEHLGAVIAARPRTKDVIRDVTTAGLVVGRPRLTRLDVRVETAIAAFLDTSMTARGSPLPSQSRPGNDEAWEHEVCGKNGPSITGPTVADVERAHPLLKEVKTVKESPIPLARRGRLNELQAQLSRLSDRMTLRRLKDALQAHGAWQRVGGVRICVTHTSSHKWLYHLDACAGSVLAPHDFVVNV